MTNYSPELISFYTEVMTAFNILSFTFLVVGAVVGFFVSGFFIKILDKLDYLFKRPNRIKTSTGDFLYRVKNVYLTKLEYDQHKKMLLESRKQKLNRVSTR